MCRNTFDNFTNPRGVNPYWGATPAAAANAVWAIGTGLNATAEQAEEVHAYIRELLKKRYDEGLAKSVRIQYGGSVKPDNVKELIGEEDVDGALVGGASLKADGFVNIVNGCLK